MRQVTQLLLGCNEFVRLEHLQVPHPLMMITGPRVPDSRLLKTKALGFMSECPLVPT